jgi:predicted nucleotidyltransferase
MDMKDEWLAALRRWAMNNDCVRELWLFGSRAKGAAKPESDIDVAIGLMPPTGKHNWAIAAYVEFFEDWNSDLRKAVHWDVSLTAIGPRTRYGCGGPRHWHAAVASRLIMNPLPIAGEGGSAPGQPA